MGLFGGNDTQKTTNTSTGGTSYAPWISDAQWGLAGLGLNMNKNFLGQSPEYAVAGLTPDQLHGMDLGRRMVADQFGSGAMTTMDGGTIDGNSYQEFMNPFLNDVGKDALGDMRRTYDDAIAGAGVRSANSVAFGGSGPALERAQMTRGYLEDVPGVIAGIQSAGFDRATNTALQNAQLEQSKAALQDRFRGTAFDRQMGARDALMQGGNQQQLLAQASLDAPHEALARLAALIPSVYGHTTWQSSTSEAPDNSPGGLQSLLGLGGSILGLDVAGGGSLGGNWLAGILGN